MIGKVPKVTERIIYDWLYHNLQAGRGFNELASLSKLQAVHYSQRQIDLSANLS